MMAAGPEAVSGEARAPGREAGDAAAGAGGTEAPLVWATWSVVMVHFFMMMVSRVFAHGVLLKRIDMSRLRTEPISNDISLNIGEQALRVSDPGRPPP